MFFFIKISIIQNFHKKNKSKTAFQTLDLISRTHTNLPSEFPEFLQILHNHSNNPQVPKHDCRRFVRKSISLQLATSYELRATSVRSGARSGRAGLRRVYATPNIFANVIFCMKIPTSDIFKCLFLYSG